MMGSDQKELLKSRPTLRLPDRSRDHGMARRVTNPQPAADPPASVRPRDDTTALLQELFADSLWPMVEAAFRGVDEHVEARFFQLDDLQVVISRGPAKPRAPRETPRALTLEVWPSAGPRLLELEWRGRRPYIVHRRDGDWLHRFLELSTTVR